MIDLLALEPLLLDADPIGGEVPADFAACLNERGLYSTNQFVLRLNPRIHALVDAASPGLYAEGDLTEETLQAYSTYLHETIHWWQHMGSTSGLIYSLARPVQTHLNDAALSKVVQSIGGKKSLKRWAEERLRGGTRQDDPVLAAANSIVNNAIDVEFYKRIVLDPKIVPALQSERYFESVGHSYWMAYGQALSVLTATVDREMDHLPNGPTWEEGFRQVREAGLPGFAYQGPVTVAPLGLRALYEGQARMLQLQYLTFGASNPPSLAQLREAGFFDTFYGEAFDAFLEITGAIDPPKIDHPVVGLFLLIVDLAINPTRGFPLDIESFADFVTDTDPGIRFWRLSMAVRDNPSLLGAIVDYSAEEYGAIADQLTEACGYDHPLAALQEIGIWAHEAPGVVDLMRQQANFQFDPSNIVIRVLFSHFIAFSQDKLAHPEFFCWPGAWMAGERVAQRSQTLFLRHLSLYTDRADDDGIYPRYRPGADPKALTDTLSSFYANIVLYDLTWQWIFRDARGLTRLGDPGSMLVHGWL